jgi:hypoxanthine phosphoribosyltransferase
LIVDDVFDSGRSVDALIKQIKQQMRLNMPHDVRIATPWYKPKNNKTDIVPDYYIRESDEWLVFPHELAGLTEQEIRDGKTELSNIMDVLF